MRKVASPRVPSWNQLLVWLIEMDALQRSGQSVAYGFNRAPETLGLSAFLSLPVASESEQPVHLDDERPVLELGERQRSECIPLLVVDDE